MRQVVGVPNNSYKPITNTAWVCARLCKLQKRVHSTRTDKVYQLLAHALRFSPGTPASSTTKTGRHDIAEILLKVALNTKKQKSIIQFSGYRGMIPCQYHQACGQKSTALTTRLPYYNGFENNELPCQMFVLVELLTITV